MPMSAKRGHLCTPRTLSLRHLLGQNYFVDDVYHAIGLNQIGHRYLARPALFICDVDFALADLLRQHTTANGFDFGLAVTLFHQSDHVLRHDVTGDYMTGQDLGQNGFVFRL